MNRKSKRGKRSRITVADKALTNAINKGEISIGDVPKSKRDKIRKISKTVSEKELEDASKKKYKYSKRRVVHRKNESMDIRRTVISIEEWTDGDKKSDKLIKKFDDFKNGNELDEVENVEEEITSDDENFENDEKINDIKMENNNFIKKFSKFSILNESEDSKEPKIYPKENKFKRTIEYSDDIKKSLIDHNFNEVKGNGDYILFDLMNKTFTQVEEELDDIRPCSLPEFDHMMSNL